MATLRFENINKIYDNNVQAVFDFNLDIKDKEFIVFVGPSGCGKSTTLRMVAGLEAITEGDLFIDDVLVNDIEPMNRGIAMVFQSYALYPHMTVYDNMAFSLKIRKFPVEVKDKEGNPVIVVDKEQIKKLELLIKQAKADIKDLDETEKDKESQLQAKIEEYNAKIADLKANPSARKVKMAHMPKAEIKERVLRASQILGLSDYLKRKPAALSGGQRQRVALGRAIVRSPKVFLMDEPLSNLDAKLRVQMRSELTKIHKEVGATTIYVTHDQTEAMTMADRIVVMKGGYIQQIATPREVYDNPANLFVATFIGSPAMNILEGVYDGEYVTVGETIKIKLDSNFKKAHDEFYKVQKEVSSAALEKASQELEGLNQEGARRNSKAIDQRQAIVNEHTKRLAFYEEAMSGNAHKIYFGIRPEDICGDGDVNNTNPSELFTLHTNMVELLGQDILVYTNIGEQKVLFKTNSSRKIKEEQDVKVSINLDKVHLFDYASTLKLK